MEENSVAELLDLVRKLRIENSLKDEKITSLENRVKELELTVFFILMNYSMLTS